MFKSEDNGKQSAEMEMGCERKKVEQENTKKHTHTHRENNNTQVENVKKANTICGGCEKKSICQYIGAQGRVYIPKKKQSEEKRKENMDGEQKKQKAQKRETM